MAKYNRNRRAARMAPIANHQNPITGMLRFFEWFQTEFLPVLASAPLEGLGFGVMPSSIGASVRGTTGGVDVPEGIVGKVRSYLESHTGGVAYRTILKQTKVSPAQFGTIRQTLGLVQKGRLWLLPEVNNGVASTSARARRINASLGGVQATA